MTYDLDSLLLAYYKKGWNLTQPVAVKTGKDASVYVVQANGQQAALKVYHNEKNQSIKYYLDYTNIQKIPRSIQRAIKSGNAIGKQVLQQMRVHQEYVMLQKFYESQVSIPQPFATALDTVLMEFIGKEEFAAPQLVHCHLSQEEAMDALDEILDSMEMMLDFDIVHGDLSAFNILWHEHKPWIIDFPQAINVREHSDPRGIFKRDLDNVCNYFQGYFNADSDQLMADFESYFEFI